MVIMSSLSEELCLYDFGRSTKGASKQRRDQINAEIGVMRDLLPLPESARIRLSQLQIMSLSCVYIRKCQLLEKLFGSTHFNVSTPFDFFQSLTGFLLVTTREGKLVYISENVTEYLGHSMVDMKTQGDSIYDIIDKRDHANVQAQLQQGGAANAKPDQDITFFCRMNMSRCLKRQTGPGDIKIMHVKGHFASVQAADASGEKSVFLGLCSPLITPDLKENLIQNNTVIFKSVHSLDMRFLELTENGEHYLGLTNDKVFRKSWYTMLHPEDLSEAREKHVQLIRSRHEMGCMMTVRMITESGDLLWVNVVMHVRQGLVPGSNDPVIVCVNQVVSEDEAYHFKVQSQLYSLHASRGPDYIFHSGYPGSNSPGMENEMFMPSYQLPGYYPHGVMSYPSPTGAFGGYSVPEQYPNNYPQQGAGMTCGEPLDKRETCTRKAEHAQAVEALKRKLGENGPCRGKKIPRMSLNHNSGYPPSAGHFGCVSNGTTSANQGYLTSGANNTYSTSTQGYSYGPTQVMAAPLNGHIPDLCFSLKNDGPETVVLASDISLSPRLPPTPDSSPSMITSASTTTVTPVMIKTEVLPDWYLTPEASPGSPCSQTPVTSTVTEEHVTAFAKTLGAKIEAELSRPCQHQKQQPVLSISPTKKRKANCDLPVMDGTAVNDYFEAVIGEQVETCIPRSQVISNKLIKQEISMMDPLGSLFKQPVPICLMSDRQDIMSNPDVQIVPDQSTPSPSYNPSSVESSEFLADDLVSGPGSVDPESVTMTVAVTMGETLPMDHSIVTSLGFEDNDELFNQLLSWGSTFEAQSTPDQNQ